MGSGIGKLFLCSSGTCAGDASGNLENSSAFISKQNDRAMGNSLCYVRPIPPRFSGESRSDDETTVMTFQSITGATVSANSSAAPSIFLDDSLQHSTILDSSASFESFGSFASAMVPFQYQLHHQHQNHQNQHAPIRRSLKKILSRAFLSLGKRSILRKNDNDNVNANARVSCSNSLSGELRLQDDDDDDDGSECDDLLMVCKDLHWAQGKAGEDRMHIVLCEKHGWVFVGIYDGFNGPDATDYLLNTLFYAIYDELKELLCNHNDVLKNDDVLQCLSEGLRKTEEAFLKNVNEMITHYPVLAMMGSCVLVMLMKGEDVYLMNVGDSRAVLATHTGNSLQLTMEHSTHVKEEVCRIRREHPDDPYAVMRGRVKGCLNVTRAFGAGFLKQPKQNNAVLEIFKVSYIGESPYITCSPSLHHQRLSPNDKFLILSSDGLYQYFTNEEAVAKVESFITMFPDEDPAKLLIEEALSRAAQKAGLEFHELLDIPQGERRLYHDDISIIIISFEGKIWHSLV